MPAGPCVQAVRPVTLAQGVVYDLAVALQLHRLSRRSDPTQVVWQLAVTAHTSVRGGWEALLTHKATKRPPLRPAVYLVAPPMRMDFRESVNLGSCGTSVSVSLWSSLGLQESVSWDIYMHRHVCGKIRTVERKGSRELSTKEERAVTISITS